MDKISFLDALVKDNGVPITSHNTIFQFDKERYLEATLVAVDPLGNALLSTGYVPENDYDIGEVYQMIYDIWPETDDVLVGIQNEVGDIGAQMDARHFVSRYWDNHSASKRTINTIVKKLVKYGFS